MSKEPNPFDRPEVRQAVERMAQGVKLQLQAWLPGLSEEDARHFASEACKDQVTVYSKFSSAIHPEALVELSVAKPSQSPIYVRDASPEEDGKVVVAGPAHIGTWGERTPDLVHGALLFYGLAMNPFLRAVLYAQGFRLEIKVGLSGAITPVLQ